MKTAIHRDSSVDLRRNERSREKRKRFTGESASNFVTDCHAGGKTRPVFERLVHLARALRAGRAMTAPKMAAELEVDARTIRRDLDFLRDRLRYDFGWDARACTYRLTSAPIPVL